mmetsp:Transcript_71457/g.143850  ORF Transcript_71457/g.143850 Transcript_71457/m.143850 type:complete len:422 (-) Transcript_71457:433-1698(-)
MVRASVSLLISLLVQPLLAKNLEPRVTRGRLSPPKLKEELTSLIDDSTDEEDGSDDSDDLSFNKRIQGFLTTIPHSRGEVVRSTVTHLGSAAQRARLFLREVKGSHSSEFECAVIKGTRPDNQPAKEKHVERLVETVATFPIAMTSRATPSTDYYQMMLHKLWSRMAEVDWRTVVKAVYVFHRVTLALDPELHREFLRRYQILRKTRHKQSKSKYFSSATLTRCRSEDAGFLPFIASYSAFVFERFVLFSGRFEDNDFAIGAGIEARKNKTDSLLDLLRNACRILDRTMRIKLDDQMGDDSIDGQEVVCQCLELVVKDVFVCGNTRDSLWKTFCENLSQLITMQREAAAAGEQIDAAEVQATCMLCKWGIQAPSSASRFLDKANNIAGKCGQRLPPALSLQGMPPEETLRLHMRALKETRL